MKRKVCETVTVAENFPIEINSSDSDAYPESDESIELSRNSIELERNSIELSRNSIELSSSSDDLAISLSSSLTSLSSLSSILSSSESLSLYGSSSDVPVEMQDLYAEVPHPGEINYEEMSIESSEDGSDSDVLESDPPFTYGTSPVKIEIAAPIIVKNYKRQKHVYTIEAREVFPLGDLNLDMIYCIFDQCDLRSLIRMRATCTWAKKIADSPMLLRKICLFGRRFGLKSLPYLKNIIYEHNIYAGYIIAAINFERAQYVEAYHYFKSYFDQGGEPFSWRSHNLAFYAVFEIDVPWHCTLEGQLIEEFPPSDAIQYVKCGLILYSHLQLCYHLRGRIQPLDHTLGAIAISSDVEECGV